MFQRGQDDLKNKTRIEIEYKTKLYVKNLPIISLLSLKSTLVFVSYAQSEICFCHLAFHNRDHVVRRRSVVRWLLTLWQAERHFCHLRFTGAATILSFFRSILQAWILLAKLSVNVQ